MDNDQERDPEEERYWFEHCPACDHSPCIGEGCEAEDGSANPELLETASWAINWAARWIELKKSMTGFIGLTKWMQGLLVGHSLVTGEIWCTTDYETTRSVVRRVFAEAVESTMAMGFEQ